MKINDDTITEILSPCLKKSDSVLYYCYGIINAKIGSMITADDRNYIIGFTDKKLIIIRLDGEEEPKKSIAISYKQIKYATTSNWLLGFGYTIKMYFDNEFMLEFELKKNVLGIKEQKENLREICEMLNKKFE